MKKMCILVLLALVGYNAEMFAILNVQDAQKIGTLIWNNEADKRVDLLAFWGSYSAFPEVGIGHYIWYPQGQTGVYTQQFPPLCAYMQEQGAQLPAWLQDALIAGGAPWQSRDAFLQDTERADGLRQFLASTVELQTQFMIKRLEDEWSLILQAASEAQRAHLCDLFTLMRSTLLGTYALVDYLNFKGNGLNPREERNGYRWGLLQVLLDMPDGLTEENVTKAFSISAANRLVQYIRVSGPEYKPVKFLAGWIKRVSTYAKPQLLE